MSKGTEEGRKARRLGGAIALMTGTSGLDPAAQSHALCVAAASIMSALYASSKKKEDSTPEAFFQGLIQILAQDIYENAMMFHERIEEAIKTGELSEPE